MPSALILIAEGTEEMEFTIAYDVLVRGGIEVKSAFVGSSETGGTQNPHGQANDSVTCSRGVKIVPDMRLPELAGGKALEYDAIVVPGGNKGAETISKNEDVTKLLGAFYAKGKVVACICAGELDFLLTGWVLLNAEYASLQVRWRQRRQRLARMAPSRATPRSRVNLSKTTGTAKTESSSPTISSRAVGPVRHLHLAWRLSKHCRARRRGRKSKAP